LFALLNAFALLGCVLGWVPKVLDKGLEVATQWEGVGRCHKNGVGRSWRGGKKKKKKLHMKKIVE
jgi:hypothetical protein